jgi:hypothetical protein
MKPGILRLLLMWGLLILLGSTELAASYLPIARSWRPLIMIPGVLMVLVVSIAFMEVKKGPVIVRAFAVGALFWLFVLLALGSADPFTRTNYYVPDTHVK